MAFPFSPELTNELPVSELKEAKKTDLSSGEALDKKIRLEIGGNLPRSGGVWTGETGDSRWKPEPGTEPGDRHGTNPEHKTWKEILEPYQIDSIPFRNGYPDFSEVGKGTVEIEDFTDARDANFAQADERLALQKGYTPEQVEAWRKENRYTWHECADCRTMQKVPTEIHGNIPHSGGISVQKLMNQTI